MIKSIAISCFMIACVAIAACGDDPILPPDELAPPTNLTMVTGSDNIQLAWNASPDAGSSVFEGYNVYVDTVSIVAIADSTGASFLNLRKVNASPLQTRSFTITSLANGTGLQTGKKYYAHVRSERNNGRLSVGSNEIDTAPRPSGDNGNPNLMLLMFDYDANTDTRSGYGWARGTGLGAAQVTAPANQDKIDFFMTEEPNSSDNGSLFVSPAQASFTASWSQRNRTLFRDLGVGADAWNTSVAPDTASMTQTVKVLNDHTYAVYTHDGYWAKIRVTRFDKNVGVPRTGGGTANLNRAQFDHAFQVIQGYGRFKPGGAN